MANHKSALKRHRQSVKRNTRNKAMKSEILTLTNKLLKASKEEAAELFKKVQGKLDKAKRKGLLKSNTVARKVSRLQKNTLNA